MMPTALPTFDDVQRATERVAPHIVRTPMLRSSALDEIARGTVLVKAEPLQLTGSFKIRGALNRILCLSDAERRAGVVAWSSGNHAQGVAAAAGMFEVPAVIVMPSDAPALKIENTRQLGADVVLYDRATEDREVISYDIAAKRGLTVIPSYDDPHIIAGQGTLGLEAFAQAQDLGIGIDHVVVPVSGGGLIAGVGLAARAARPDVRIYSAEPAAYDDHARSIAAQSRATNSSKANALCDALLAPTPGELTWRINASQLSAGYAVTDDDVCAAMAFAFRHLKLVIEPGGAVALAAILSGRHQTPGAATLVVVSGGNVDRATYRACLSRGESAFTHGAR
jgi:threonine dehydratase